MCISASCCCTSCSLLMILWLFWYCHVFHFKFGLSCFVLELMIIANRECLRWSAIRLPEHFTVASWQQATSLMAKHALCLIGPLCKFCYMVLGISLLKLFFCLEACQCAELNRCYCNGFCSCHDMYVHMNVHVARLTDRLSFSLSQDGHA